jgi:hypothetical protein
MSIGDPVPRPDGPAKVTGRAKYVADQSVPGILHAVCVGAPIPAGRIASIDIASALAAPGVVRDGRELGGVGLGRTPAEPSVQDDPLAPRIGPVVQAPGDGQAGEGRDRVGAQRELGREEGDGVSPLELRP